MFRIIPFAVILLASTADAAAANYFAAPGLWGIENPIILTKASSGRKKKSDITEVTPASRKSTNNTGKDNKQDEVEYVNRYFSDELDEAEEAFYRAVEHVEKAVVHAVDDEVETLFPHRKKSTTTE
ncbi:hypothetical protein ACHAWU_003500 [Discostella pseudostelligera]|uniref:Uncharacterized protein n=1 Tax=Discostella pseudostelligera TaxID=259834 RepID=A0ABD3M8A8_9STRA